MTPPQSALVAAVLSESEADARARWREWRSTVDVTHLTWEEIQLIPLLNGPRLTAWLVGDEAEGVLKGIVRRSWTEAQVRLALARDVTSSLVAAGVETIVLFGAAATNLTTRAPSVRAIPELRLLIPRADIVRAVRALEEKGWRISGELPSAEGYDWSTHVCLARDGTQLYLHWRVLNVRAGGSAACERDFVAGLELVEYQGHAFRVLSPACALLATVAERTDSGTSDVIPWQVDAARMAREKIDWNRFTRLASNYCPTAFDRMAELRALGVAFPVLHPLKPRRSLMAFLRDWRRRMISLPRAR